MTENTETKRVCVVENDEAVRTSLSRLLRASRIEVELFPSMSDFFDAQSQIQCACVLLDLRSLMPREYAILTEEFRKTRTMLPIIAVSDLDDETSNRKARELGARFLLHKPVDGQALLDAIHWITDSSEHTAMQI